MHICYGYGIDANIKWKETLGAEWRQYEAIFPALNASKIDQVSLECAGSHVPISLISHLKNKDVLVGVIDVASTEIETPEQVAATIREAMKHADAERIQPCTNCGMAPLSRELAVGKLQGARRRGCPDAQGTRPRVTGLAGRCTGDRVVSVFRRGLGQWWSSGTSGCGRS